MINGKIVEYILFDLFNTLFKVKGYMSTFDRKHYQRVMQTLPWEPLLFSNELAWLPPFPEVIEGLNRLASNYNLITCSNCPIALQEKLLKNHNMKDHFDDLIDFAAFKVYKPNLSAYLVPPYQLGESPSSLLMVTANKTFGDLEGARHVGMQAVCIRDAEGPANLLGLAELLGC